MIILTANYGDIVVVLWRDRGRLFRPL